MPTPRKFCWIYRNVKTGELVRVRRPRRRIVNPTWWVERKRDLVIERAEFAWSDFRKIFKFVMRAPS